MANPEHFTSKNSTVIEYALGFKKEQQRRYQEPRGASSVSTQDNNKWNNNYSSLNSSSMNDYNDPNNSFNQNNANNYQIQRNNHYQVDNSKNVNTSWFDNHNNNHNGLTDVNNQNLYSRNNVSYETKTMAQNQTAKSSPLNTQKPGNLNAFFKKHCCTIFTAVVLTFAALALLALTLFCLLYFGVLNTSPTYLQACSAVNTCSMYKGLVCNGTCICEANKYWDGSICTLLLPFGSTCAYGSYQCESGLTCLNGICQCSSTTYYSGGQCLNKKSYGSDCSSCSYSTCSNCISCSQCQDYSYGFCNTTISKCMCTAGANYDLTNQRCLQNATFNDACLSTTQCDLTKGLICVNAICACSTSGYYFSKTNQNCQLCPTGWTILKYGNGQTCIRDYSASLMFNTWLDANTYCANQYSSARVLKLNDATLSSVVKASILKKDANYWLDASDNSIEGKFVWRDGQVVDNQTVSWCTNQPDGGSSENCLAIVPLTWCIVDSVCSSNNYFICQLN